MADSSETPDWFGNVIMNWIGIFLVYVVFACGVVIVWNIIWLNWFGVTDLWGGIARGMMEGFAPPLAKEKMSWMDEFGGNAKAYWA